MPVKTEVVPVPSEEGEAASEQPEAASEEKKPKRAPKNQIPKAQAKRVSKKAAPQDAPQEAVETPHVPEEPAEPAEPEPAEPEAKPKSRAKAKAKAKGTVDLSQKTKCSVCKRVVTNHCLLYTHKCPKAALDERKKIPTVEEEAAPPPPKLERASARDMKQWVEENPAEPYPHQEELPTPEVWAPPPTFVETEGGGYLTIAERRVHHREALERQYREYQLHKKQNQIAHLRQFYR